MFFTESNKILELFVGTLNKSFAPFYDTPAPFKSPHKIPCHPITITIQ